MDQRRKLKGSRTKKANNITPLSLTRTPGSSFPFLKSNLDTGSRLRLLGSLYQLAKKKKEEENPCHAKNGVKEAFPLLKAPAFFRFFMVNTLVK